MSECQSKCACGDICRRVDGHLQHQCPKCNYEQRWTAKNVAATPATPAATPMREANQRRVDAAAQRVRKVIDGYSADHGFRKDVELLIEIALAPVLEIFAAAAQPVATPMAGNGYETAAVMRDLFREWWDKHDTATKLRTPQEMTAFQRIQNAFYAGALAIMERQRAVAMNSEAPQKLPAAAQPQRESEQPEQVADWARAQAYDLASEFHKLGQSSKDKSVTRAYFDCAQKVEDAFVQIIHEQAALSPQTDSQEPR